MITQESPQVNPEDYQHKLLLAEAVAELEAKQKQIKIKQGYRKAYFWSVALAPIGVFYFFKYLFFTGGDKESIRVGIISLILTIVSLFVSFLLMAVFLKQVTTGTSSQSLQMLKDLTVPANQKALLQLYK